MTFNESDLIAYQLHELSPRRARAIRRALAVDPALAAEAEAIAYTLRAFAPPPAPVVDAALLDRTWNVISPSLLRLPPPAPQRLWRVPMTAAAGLALTAAIVLWFAILSAGHSIHTPPANTPTVAHTSPAPGPNASASLAPQQLATAAQNDTYTGAQNSTALITLSATIKPLAAHNTAPTPLRSAFHLPAVAPLTTVAMNAFRTLPLEQQQPFSAPGNSLLAFNQASVVPPPTASTSSSTLARHTASHPVHEHETDVSVGGFADLTADRSIVSSLSGTTGTIVGGGSTGSTEAYFQSVRPAAGVLVSFHQQLRRAIGYQLSAAYTRTTFDYSYNASGSGSAFTSSGLIPAKVFELSGAYVVAGPKSHRLSTHAGAGAGMLAFVPDASPQQSTDIRPAGIAMASVNYRIKRHWSLRAEYRALFFRGPDFHNTNTNIPVITRYTVSSEPTLGLDYRFGPLIRP
jgi:anti-sigma factor RsiW